MKKLLLTSDGLSSEKLKKEFLKLLPKSVETIKILLIFGVKTDEEMFYVQESKKELIELGVLGKNIIEANINSDLDLNQFNKLDAIYFCGGNTHYLLDRIKKLKFDKLIKKFVDDKTLYVGVSAGSIIAGKNIEIAGWGSEGDKNEVGLKDLSGLNFTEIAIFPHYKNSQKEEVDEFKIKVSYPVEELKDGEAILILGNKVRKIKCPPKLIRKIIRK